MGEQPRPSAPAADRREDTGAWQTASHRRQEHLGCTWRTTRNRPGTHSRSPSPPRPAGVDSRLPPHAGQAPGAGCCTTSRGGWSGNGRRAGLPLAGAGRLAASSSPAAHRPAPAFSASSSSSASSSCLMASASRWGGRTRPATCRHHRRSGPGVQRSSAGGCHAHPRPLVPAVQHARANALAPRQLRHDHLARHHLGNQPRPQLRGVLAPPVARHHRLNPLRPHATQSCQSGSSKLRSVEGRGCVRVHHGHSLGRHDHPAQGGSDRTLALARQDTAELDGLRPSRRDAHQLAGRPVQSQTLVPY